MNATIVGGILSFSFACYQGKAPCSLHPGTDNDKLTLSADTGQDGTIDQIRLGLGADWKEPVYENGDFKIDGRWEISTNHWKSTLNNPKNKEGWIIGLTPVFHYTWTKGSVIPYFELGTGPHWISNITIEDEYKSTQFQFGNILGFGISSKHFELGYRYLHISNANIELPNPGTDFHNIHFGYKF
ncbi:MAG: acyloxyacyl hydrolase [Hydrogenovibrio sp.]|nr:acyloxyacyl hydrolase [Hydrogenovibrio sp.]